MSVVDAPATVAGSTAERRVRRFYECVDRGDVPGLVDLFAADSVYHRPGYEPYRGRHGMARFYGRERVIRDGRHTIHTLIAADGEVAVRGEFHGALHDGSAVHLRFADFFTVAANGQFTRRDTFFFAPLA
jgi:steroid delta-isomerase